MGGKLVSTILDITRSSGDSSDLMVFERDGVASLCTSGCGGFGLERVHPEETQNADHLESGKWPSRCTKIRHGRLQVSGDW